MPVKTKTKEKKPKVLKVAKQLKAEQKIIETLEKSLELTKETNGEKYYEAIGRRKSSLARVRIYTKKAGDGESEEDRALISVNNQDYLDYFKNIEELKNTVEAPLRKLKSIGRFKATVKVSGGGTTGQAEAIRHGLSRALILFDPNFAKKLKKSGYLTRDSREKERRKYGLKKARKAPQWAKR